MPPQSDEDYTTPGLPPPPLVSKTTMPMSGLLVDIYGLEELSSPDIPLTILWLLHPRLRRRARMADIACRVVHAYNNQSTNSSVPNISIDGQDHPPPGTGPAKRGLIALAFDLPNHGTRCVSPSSNNAWDKGNETHAIDMMGMVKGARSDLSGLMDVVEGYLRREVQGQFVLGWSLGGHAAWQVWMGEERIDGVVVIVGCPDFVGLMSDRAKNANLPCDPFLGSTFFPPSLLTTSNTHDPKSILFPQTPKQTPLPSLPLSHKEQTRLRQILDARGCLKDKKLLLCSGGEDPLVPWKNSEGFVEVLKDVGVDVDGRVYAGVGHKFSKDMVTEVVEWIVGAVGEGPRQRARI